MPVLVEAMGHEHDVSTNDNILAIIIAIIITALWWWWSSAEDVADEGGIETIARGDDALERILTRHAEHAQTRSPQDTTAWRVALTL